MLNALLWQGVEDLLGGTEEEEAKEEEEGGAQRVRSPSSAVQNLDLINTDGTLILFPGSSCSRTGWVFSCRTLSYKQPKANCSLSISTMC